MYLCMQCKHTVGGRNPAPADRLFIPLFVGFQPSKMVQDFVHPQYEIYVVSIWACLTIP